MARINNTLTAKFKKDICQWNDYWKRNRNTYNEFTEFVMGNQWLDDESRVMERYQKRPQTFNKIAPLINHLLGEQIQNTPTLQIQPSEDVPVETADVRQALIKDITLSSDTNIVFQTAFQCAAIGGYGAFELGTEYDDAYSFNQHIVFKEKKIPNNCFWDVGAESPCKTDGMFSGSYSYWTRRRFKSVYGNIESKIASEAFDDNMVFADEDAITVVDYYKREYKQVKIIQLSNGRVVEANEFAELERIMIDDIEWLIDQGNPVTVDNERMTPRYTIKHYRFAGDYILEEADFPSEQLPTVFVDQNSYYDKKGAQLTRSLVKDAKDAQVFLNYLGTQISYLLKITRYDQFMASKENIRSNDTAQQWRNPSVVQGAIIYDESPQGNKPEQIRPPEIPQSLIQQYQRALEDIQSSVGMYDARVGVAGNEISGAAIDARTKQGSYSTYKVFGSLNRAIACSGTIVNEMIPNVYDTERSMMLNMPDTGLRKVTLNQPADEYGTSIKNDMSIGRYTIRLMPGPSWEGQREEALESIKEVLAAQPQIFTLIADLYAENLPLKNNMELRNRLRTIVPPEIIEAGKTGQPIPPKQDQGPSPEEQMMQIKMKEVQLKEQQIQQEQVKLQMQSEMNNQELQLKWHELEDKRIQTAAQLQEMVLRFNAEAQRTHSQEQIAHADNLVKLLTAKHKEALHV